MTKHDKYFSAIIEIDEQASLKCKQDSNILLSENRCYDNAYFVGLLEQTRYKKVLYVLGYGIEARDGYLEPFRHAWLQVDNAYIDPSYYYIRNQVDQYRVCFSAEFKVELNTTSIQRRWSQGFMPDGFNGVA